MKTDHYSATELHKSADHFHRFGYAVLPDAVTVEECERLKSQALSLSRTLASPGPRHRFTTDEARRTDDRYFLDSGREIRVFYEDDVANRPPMDRPNKLGHALHDKDPTFARFSRRPLFSRLAQAVGFRDPILIQSMYIFKGSGGGGRVAWHQDATFLHSDPVTVVGIWVALDHAHRGNGCLHVIPGGHQGPLRRRMVRDKNDQTRFIEMNDEPFELGLAIPLEVSRGSVVLLHGLLPHFSEVNESSMAREAYTLHIIEGDAHYSEDNWLCPEIADPWTGFENP